ncbi:DUF4900 domain-containing protein [Candidatus Omnitrophota bacterium]
MKGLKLTRLLNNNKGFIFAIVMLAIVFVVGLSAAFFMRATAEKKLVDIEKYTTQASFLGEAGAHHALSELRTRIRVDLASAITAGKGIKSRDLDKYTGRPLQFLVDYAYAGEDAQFSISGSQATLALSSLSLPYDIDGNYGAQIIITAPTNPNLSYPNTNPTNPAEDVYVFYYNYAVEGTGNSTATSPNISKNTSLLGSFSVTVRKDNFARYALLTDKHQTPDGNPVWFTETTNFGGPVHTNEHFYFANNPGASFSGKVTQKKQEAWFFNDGTPVKLKADRNGDLDVPIFDQGFERNAEKIDIKKAVKKKDLEKQTLGKMEKPDANGVYLGVEDSSVTGGIYIKGDVSDLVCAATESGPQYTITQGATTTTITVDYDSNATTVSTGAGVPISYTGLPDGLRDEGIVIYSENNVSNVSGTVQAGTQMTLSAKKDIVISGHLRYEDYSGSPPSAAGATNMLGIISAEGDVRIGAAAPDNVEIHGIVVAPKGVFAVDDYATGAPRGTVTLLGGSITKNYGTFGTSQGGELVSGYGRSFVYDERVQSDQIPPYFPEMKNFTSIEYGLSDRPLWKIK